MSAINTTPAVHQLAPLFFDRNQLNKNQKRMVSVGNVAKYLVE
jgi:hypothetical protein